MIQNVLPRKPVPDRDAAGLSARASRGLEQSGAGARDAPLEEFADKRVDEVDRDALGQVELQGTRGHGTEGTPHRGRACDGGAL